MMRGAEMDKRMTRWTEQTLDHRSTYVEHSRTGRTFIAFESEFLYKSSIAACGSLSRDERKYGPAAQCGLQ